MNYYDISPTISPRTQVFPGDREFSRDIMRDFRQGDDLLLSSITTTLHIGAHIDAPSHYRADGAGIGELPLDVFYGICQVLPVAVARGTRISVADLQGREITAERVLFRTGSFPDPEHWNSDFCGLSAELIDVLAAKGVRLIGIDTPSIDLQDSDELESHRAAGRHGLIVLEGLALAGVPEGRYRLVALPLKIEGADASPVRAILVDLEQD